jgi:hypothetical protein
VIIITFPSKLGISAVFQFVFINLFIEKFNKRNNH